MAEGRQGGIGRRRFLQLGGLLVAGAGVTTCTSPGSSGDGTYTQPTKSENLEVWKRKAGTPYAVGEKVKTVSVAEILGEAIRRIHFGESVTSLFDIS